MDIQALDNGLVQIIEKKSQLSNLDYNDETYDSMEEELHDLEDSFLESYGGYLEDALHEVHDEYCPDNDVLLPIAYLPNKVTKNGDTYEVDSKEGVYVEVDDYEGNDTKLVLLPRPTRIVLHINPTSSETVWTAK